MSMRFPSSSLRGFMIAFRSGLAHEKERGVAGRSTDVVKLATCGRSSLILAML